MLEIDTGTVNQERKRWGTFTRSGKDALELGIINLIPRKVRLIEHAGKGLQGPQRGCHLPSNAFNKLAEEPDPWP
jgi:hypothetical protein